MLRWERERSWRFNLLHLLYPGACLIAIRFRNKMMLQLVTIGGNASSPWNPCHGGCRSQWHKMQRFSTSSKVQFCPPFPLISDTHRRAVKCSCLPDNNSPQTSNTSPPPYTQKLSANQYTWCQIMPIFCMMIIQYPFVFKHKHCSLDLVRLWIEIQMSVFL